MKLTIQIVAVFIIASLASGCASSSSSGKTEGPAAATQTTSYEAVGVVKGIDPKEPIIEIDHENIPGLMPAMQMQFHVKDRSLLEGLAVNDRIKFTVEHGVGGLKITAITKQ